MARPNESRRRVAAGSPDATISPLEAATSRSGDGSRKAILGFSDCDLDVQLSYKDPGRAKSVQLKLPRIGLNSV
jgi:hypothetical protein